MRSRLPLKRTQQRKAEKRRGKEVQRVRGRDRGCHTPTHTPNNAAPSIPPSGAGLHSPPRRMGKSKRAPLCVVASASGGVEGHAQQCARPVLPPLVCPRGPPSQLQAALMWALQWCLLERGARHSHGAGGLGWRERGKRKREWERGWWPRRPASSRGRELAQERT